MSQPQHVTPTSPSEADTSLSVESLSVSEAENKTSPDELPLTDFDHDGEWDDESLSGPAIHVPFNFKDIEVTSFRVEWLNISEPKNNFFAKNHMVAMLVFGQAVPVRGIDYGSARLSMELGDLSATSTRRLMSRAKVWEPGTDYHPGIYTFEMLPYTSPTRRAAHHLSYPVKEGTTVGVIIDTILHLKMHHFLFLPYTSESRWKGCGDHLLHVFGRLCDKGIITSRDANEPNTRPLWSEMTTTYFSQRHTKFEPIGRGFWLAYNPIDDVETPETAFSDRRPTYLLPTARD